MIIISLLAGVFFIISTLITARASQGLLIQSRITTASNVRVRSEPNTSAAEVTKLPIGVVLRPSEQSKTKEKIGNAEDYWYRVALADGKEGWVFGGFTAVFDAKDRDAIYKRIASDRLKVKDAGFGDSSDLARFLTAAAKEVTDKSALSWIELSRLLAMKQAAATIPIDRQEQVPFKDWIKANEASLVYSEPAGMWLVKSDLFWNLQKKYSTLPIAGQIAWEAATNYLPGECEGYIPCHVARINLTNGRYLQLYPQGAHAEEALTQMAEELQSVAEASLADKPGPEDKKEAMPEIIKLRATLAKTAGAKKADVLRLLDRFEKYYH